MCDPATCDNGKCRTTGECVDVLWERSPPPALVTPLKKIYLAARFSDRPKMEIIADRLKALGFEITARWVYGGEDGLTREDIAILDVDDVIAADTIVSFTHPRGTLTGGGGRHVEFGYGLALGKRLVVIGARENVFHYHPSVEFYETLDAWFRALGYVDSPPLAPNLCETDPENCGCAEITCTPSAPRTLIAFNGLAGSGKSTAAAHLVNRHGFTQLRFAGPLKNMMVALGCSPAEIDGDRKEVPCVLLGGKTPRHAMQTLGTEWGRDLISDDLWIRAFNAALAKVPAGTPVVVDDCRFPNEAEAVTAAGGVLVRIDRPGAGTTSVHASEQQALAAAATLLNNDDQWHLFAQVDRLVADLSWRHTDTAS